MITLALLLATWQEAPGYSQGPFNLVLRWGAGAPVVIRYDNRARCELAALAAATTGDAIGSELDDKGRVRPAPVQVRGANAPFAFCIPG